MCELTVLMPCKNECETVESCVQSAKSFLADHNIEGEVLVIDNASTDESGKLAQNAGARVVSESSNGYGCALITGTKAALGKYVIMCDADSSYDVDDMMPVLEKLREGNALVVGDRFAGGIEPGAMPVLHRFIGNPLLSALGRMSCHSKIRDFHCGLRGYDREAILGLDLFAPGFEYASEMIVKSERAGLKIAQVPVRLKRDGRKMGHSHIRMFRDGIRHLKVLFS